MLIFNYLASQASPGIGSLSSWGGSQWPEDEIVSFSLAKASSVLSGLSGIVSLLGWCDIIIYIFHTNSKVNSEEVFSFTRSWVYVGFEIQFVEKAWNRGPAMAHSKLHSPHHLHRVTGRHRAALGQQKAIFRSSSLPEVTSFPSIPFIAPDAYGIKQIANKIPPPPINTKAWRVIVFSFCGNTGGKHLAVLQTCHTKRQ